MKRLSLCVALILFLCACGRVKPTPPDYPFSVNGTVEAVYSDIRFKASVKNGQSSLTLTVSQPEELKGFTVISGENGTVIQNASLSLEYQNDSLEKICPLAEIYDILTALNTQKTELTPSGEKLIAYFDYGGKKCSALINPQSLKIEELKSEKCNFIFT